MNNTNEFEPNEFGISDDCQTINILSVLSVFIPLVISEILPFTTYKSNGIIEMILSFFSKKT